MITANDVYSLKVERVSNNLSLLVGFYYNFIPEIYEYSDNLKNLKNEKIEIRIHHQESFDDRRLWRLGSVWFENKPVMIIQNAGREGDDYCKRFITDFELYEKMIKYIETLLVSPNKFRESMKDFINPTLDNPKLLSFHGYGLSLMT